ncbi:MAG: SDR family oxidoreductase [Candidatus Aminicenantales bacterium]
MTASTFRTALITGASAGMGAEFAAALAAAGSNLILVARRKEKLDALAAELAERHGVTVEALQADLEKDEDLQRVEGRIAADETLDLLVNNAGFGSPGPFSRTQIGTYLSMIQVHTAASIRLTRAALDGMILRRRGWIVNVASMAAFSPLSGPVYSATKAFLVSFSENLQYELAGTGVRLQALCPGMTHTEFHEVIRMDKSRIPGFMWMSAGDVVRISLRALGRRKVVCIPGLKNRLIAVPMRCAPMSAFLRWVAGLPYFRRKAGLPAGPIR